MKVPNTFAEIESDPDFSRLPYNEQNQLRDDWIRLRLRVSGKPRDESYFTQLQEEAYKNAPDFAKPQKPGFAARHPRVTAFFKTLYGAPMKALETPQQLVANLIDPIFSGDKPKSVKEALIRPFQRTGEWMVGEREETELPGGAITRVATDPLSVIPLVQSVRAIGAGREAVRQFGKGALAPKELKEFIRGYREKLLRSPTRVAAEKEIFKEIPRSWATFSPEQRQIYKDIISAGQRYVPKEELQPIAETLANATKGEAAQAIRILQGGNMNKINSLKAWANRAEWKRGKFGQPLKAAPQATPPGGTASVVEEATSPGTWADYINKMMQSPEL